MAGIIDIRHECLDYNLRKNLVASLCDVQRSLPSLLLWDEQGSRLFDEMTDSGSKDSYGENTEMDLLRAYVHDIARAIGDNSVIVDLGAG